LELPQETKIPAQHKKSKNRSIRLFWVIQIWRILTRKENRIKYYTL